MVPPDHQISAREGDSPSPHTFDGFEPITANFLYCPNQFYDVCLSQCDNRGVVRIVGYVLRQQLGWIDGDGNLINETVTVSYEEIIRRAGVSNGAVSDSIAAAVALGFLRCVEAPRPNARNQSARHGTYEIRWDRSGRYVTDLNSFRGFHAGSHFTPTPNQFFDVILPNEPLSVLKVVGAVVRHTVGYETKFGQRKQLAAMPHSLLTDYTNLSAGKVINGAVQSTLSKGYIRCVKRGRFDPRGREFGEASQYAMNWRHEAKSREDTPKSPAKIFQVKRSKMPSESTPKSPAKRRSKKPSSRKTVPNHNKRQAVAFEFQEAFDLLMEVEFNGEQFNRATALKLAQSRGLDVIERQIAWFPKRKIDRNPLGGLRSAIEQDWSAPIDVQVRRRNQQSTRREKEDSAAKAAEIAAVDRAKKELRRCRKAALPLWNGKSDEERIAIERSAHERLNSDFHRKQFRTNDDFRLEKCLEELCRQEGTVPVAMLAN